MNIKEINEIREHLKNIWRQTSTFKCSKDVQLEVNLIREKLRKTELKNGLQ